MWQGYCANYRVSIWSRLREGRQRPEAWDPGNHAREIRQPGLDNRNQAVAHLYLPYGLQEAALYNTSEIFKYVFLAIDIKILSNIKGISEWIVS